MYSRVLPSPSRNPSPSHALSSVRTTVVPTASTVRPSAFAASTAAFAVVEIV